MSIRIKLIQLLIEINERFIFYPRLSRYYKSLLVDKPVILDVGSNKGQSIDFFTKLRPEAVIYGFEPNPDLFQRLKNTYGSSKNLNLFNLGVSNINGELLFSETITNETSTFEDLNYDSDYLKMKARVLGVEPSEVIRKQYPVAVTTLREFISENKLTHIDLLKIDTEGHELKCLQGLFPLGTMRVDLIQIEYHLDDMYKNAPSGIEMQTFLEENGYTLHNRVKHGFGDFEEWIFKQV